MSDIDVRLTETAPQDAIDGTIAGLRAELGKADTKASILPLATLAGIATKALDGDLHLPLAGVIVGMAGVVCLMAAAVLLLLTVMPHLGAGGWPSWARLSVPEVAEQIAAGQSVQEAHKLACSTARKFRRVRYAIFAILIGVALLAVAVGITAV